MLKKSTLLSVSILFLLFIGLSDYGYGCHKGFAHGQSGPCDPPPDPEPPGRGEDAHYSVLISGPVSGTSGIEPWLRGSRHSIGLNGVTGLDVGGFTDLSFFYDRFFEKDGEERGENCFFSATGLFFEASITRHKGGSALGQFWFWGCTDEGTDEGECNTELLYELDLFGTFDGPWLPDTTTLVEMTDWEMFGGNESDACRAEGDFDDPDTPVVEEEVHILVTRTN